MSTSQKITSKNLSYDTTLPPFLARLRGLASGSSDAPDPIIAARRRPTGKRSASTEAEDAPTVVDEAGNVVRAQVGLDGHVRLDGDTERSGAERDENGKEDGGEGNGKSPEVAAIGVARKRKAATGKVVGGGPEGGGGEERRGRHNDAEIAPVKAKKKAKKVKLSFDEDGG